MITNHRESNAEERQVNSDIEYNLDKAREQLEGLLKKQEEKGKSWVVKHLKKQEQQEEVKRLQGIVNQNAKTKDPAAGARYIPREERIQHHYDNLEAARSKRRNVKFI